MKGVGAHSLGSRSAPQKNSSTVAAPPPSGPSAACWSSYHCPIARIESGVCAPSSSIVTRAPPTA